MTLSTTVFFIVLFSHMSVTSALQCSSQTDHSWVNNTDAGCRKVRPRTFSQQESSCRASARGQRLRPTDRRSRRLHRHRHLGMWRCGTHHRRRHRSWPQGRRCPVISAFFIAISCKEERWCISKNSSLIPSKQHPSFCSCTCSLFSDCTLSPHESHL